MEFEPVPPAAYAEAYFGLRAALGALFGRKIDLVMALSLVNPICGPRSRRSARRYTGQPRDA